MYVYIYMCVYVREYIYVNMCMYKYDYIYIYIHLYIFKQQEVSTSSRTQIKRISCVLNKKEQSSLYVDYFTYFDSTSHNMEIRSIP